MPKVPRVKKNTSPGYKVVLLEVGTEPTTHFTVYEDLICAHSPYFRNILQRKRKEVEGDCSICGEPFRMGKENITYCSSCGQNFHKKCYGKWYTEKSEHRGYATCPVCRCTWVPDQWPQEVCCSNLDGDAFRLYFDWLNTRDVSPIENHEDFETALNACDLAEKIEDSEFEKALFAKLAEGLDRNPSLLSGEQFAECTRRIYSITTVLSPVRSFLVDSILSCTQYIPHDVLRFPWTLETGLAKRGFELLQESGKTKGLLEKYTR